jgi:hypothetical protein
MSFLLVVLSAGRLSVKNLESSIEAEAEFSQMEPAFDGYVGVWEIDNNFIDLSDSTAFLFKKM